MANTRHFEDHVIIVGIGLIGGSIAASIRQRYPKTCVTGIGRNASRLQEAVDAGLLTDFATELSAELFADPCVVVICLPVHLIADFVKAAARVATAETLITDAGSVKSAICDAVANNAQASARFVGAHPVAGGEQAGFEHSDPDLFVDRACVIAQQVGQPDNVMHDRAVQFWKALGCRIVMMTPHEHDQILALTSHLPHIMAAVTTSAVGVPNLSLTGSGFRDTTRIAAGGPALWKEILLGNADHVISAIEKAETLLAEYKQALRSSDGQAIETLLADAADCRLSLPKD